MKCKIYYKKFFVARYLKKEVGGVRYTNLVAWKTIEILKNAIRSFKVVCIAAGGVPPLYFWGVGGGRVSIGACV